MNEIEKRLNSSSWDMSIAHKVTKAKKKEKRRNRAIISLTAICMITSSVVFFFPFSNSQGAKTSLIVQVSGAMESVYGGYNDRDLIFAPDESIDDIIITELALR